ncbi:MAG: TetR/AcrR family transcriptional regulator [Candidatus Eremiobacteraeota bacterium]|nr:TetR/AcrR family transcriptional regulator [Candidatus Eremiobacteraeota bacterium]MBV8644176.1 TetR/AcrR family transcriptional regulator [Candidatus Eremiobacteraeota bacterium]
MSPRPYKSTTRRAAADQTRARIIAAGRELLAADDDVLVFSLDAVAKRAGVVRMTVYYQFASKAGLLEALFDDFAAHGGIAKMVPLAFEAAGDAGAALDAFVTAFAAFYDSDRLGIRRVNALAMLDAEVGRALAARTVRRRNAAEVLLARIAAADPHALALAQPAAVELLDALTRFDLFDGLAGEERRIADVAPVVQRVVRASLLNPARSAGEPRA